MSSRNRNVSFLIFLLFSILIFLLSNFGLLELPRSILSKIAVTVTSPALSFSSFLGNSTQNDTEKKLKDENLSLQKKLIDQKSLVNENKALHDQFQATALRTLDLLPTKIVGSSRFIPGFFYPDTFIVDRGLSDGVKIGDAVIFKDNLVGKITKSTEFLSEVSLVTNISFKLTARTIKGTSGVVRGEGNGDLLLDNVLLSDHLGKGDLVLTSGDLKIDQTGIPADIIIGQIVSVEGSSSDLFQRAKLKTLVDLSTLSEVFIFKGLR